MSEALLHEGSRKTNAACVFFGIYSVCPEFESAGLQSRSYS